MRKKWWQYLIQIPICLLVDCVIFFLAALLDGLLASGQQGHPTPAIIIIVLFIFGVISIVVIIRAIILCLIAIFKKEKIEGNMLLEEQKEIKKKPVWKCFIPLMVYVPVATIGIILCGKYEINSFYANPEHVGFAIPIVTFLLVIIAVIILIILLIICIVSAVKRSNRNKLL